jgi:hypothetical protein
MLVGSFCSLNAEVLRNQGDAVGEFWCTCCNPEDQLPITEPHIRRCGARNVDNGRNAGYYKLVLGSDGLLVPHIVVGFHPNNLTSQGRISHNDTNNLVLSHMAMPLDWNPNNAKRRYNLDVLQDIIQQTIKVEQDAMIFLLERLMQVDLSMNGC